MLVGVLGGPSRLREHDVVADLVIRRAAPDDTPAVLGLLEASMGWVPDSEHAAFFAWKHLENPVGTSPAWVAADPDEGDRIVGYRTFLRWEFEADGTVLRAVRAVDTATHPEYQGRGIFSRLTLHALDELQAEGVVAVFNTPNERSLPGYLKMGWRPVGKLAVGLRPRSASAAIRTAWSRTAADKWSMPTSAGLAAAEVLADEASVEDLLQRAEVPERLHTRLTPAFLKWRFGYEPLRYRVLLDAGDVAGGLVVFRLRKRGHATEAAIQLLVAPTANAKRIRRMARRIAGESGADYGMLLGGAWRDGFAVIPRMGPILVWRPLGDDHVPAAHELALSLGDVELF